LDAQLRKNQMKNVLKLHGDKSTLYAEEKVSPALMSKLKDFVIQKLKIVFGVRLTMASENGWPVEDAQIERSVPIVFVEHVTLCCFLCVFRRQNKCGNLQKQYSCTPQNRKDGKSGYWVLDLSKIK
jgi:hypothetical protein